MITLDWLHARCREEDGHLIWLGALKDGGAPTAQIDGRAVSVRRELWTLVHGLSPGVRRTIAGCGVRACVHPDCIVAVSRSQIQRGVPRSADERMRIAISQRRRFKLTDDDVRAIRASTLTQVELAAQYGISQQSVSLYKTGKVRVDFSNPFRL